MVLTESQSVECKDLLFAAAEKDGQLAAFIASAEAAGLDWRSLLSEAFAALLPVMLKWLTEVLKPKPAPPAPTVPTA